MQSRPVRKTFTSLVVYVAIVPTRDIKFSCFFFLLAQLQLALDKNVYPSL